MAKYRITAPDGRKFVITGGETPPTQEQVLSLIANYKEPEIQTPAASINELKKGLTPGQRAWNTFKQDIADITYAPRKALSGATLGASDWVLRKLGVNNYEDTENRMGEISPLAKDLTKVGGFGAELGGNMLGAGGALVKGLGKAGLEGLKLAVTAGGLEGAATGLTGSDSLSEVPLNIALGAGLGAAVPVGLHGGAVGAKTVMRPFSSRLMTEGMRGGLENVSNNPQALKLVKQGIRGSDDVAEEYLNKVNPVVRKINSETADMVDNTLTSRINVPETIAAERARYGDYMAKHGADEVMDFSTKGRYPFTRQIGLTEIPVSQELPNVSTLYKGLTPFQSGQLDKALKTGLSKTNAKAGSLESINKVKQEINEAISKARSTDKPSEVWQLQELKSKFDDAMPAGLKQADAGFARAKRLEDAFDKGTRYNPNNVSGADSIAAMSKEEQNAFAQGLFKRINNNSLTGKNLAEDALKYENTLAQVLPEEVYNPLMQGLNRQSTRYGRLSELGRAAENKLRAPEGTRIFGREQLESKGSLIGSGIDWANNLLRGRAIRQASRNLMNPEFVGLTPYWSDFVIRNPNLAAGLSATALNNIFNK